ncbi:MAG: nonstructural protein [Arizlama microvirus]|nr:MAG: nonstructural protein [Arizlama microvirus]
MVIKVFSIFDVKAKVYSNPFFMPHSGQAMRAFGDLVRDEKTEVNRHPEDYSLYQVGEYDDNVGCFLKFDYPVFLNKAVDFIES